MGMKFGMKFWGVIQGQGAVKIGGVIKLDYIKHMVIFRDVPLVIVPFCWGGGGFS